MCRLFNRVMVATGARRAGDSSPHPADSADERVGARIHRGPKFVCGRRRRAHLHSRLLETRRRRSGAEGGFRALSSSSGTSITALSADRPQQLLPDTLDEDGGVIGGEHDGDGLILISDVAVQGSGASK